MRSLILLLFGILCGVVGTVLFTTLNPTFQGSERDTAGGGNARISLDEDALATLIEANLAGLPGLEAVRVATDIREDGHVAVDLIIGTPVGVRSTLVINPGVVNGRLQMTLVSGTLGELPVPDELVARIEEPLRLRLESLAGGEEYRLTSIATADHRLTLEIQI